MDNKDRISKTRKKARYNELCTADKLTSHDQQSVIGGANVNGFGGGRQNPDRKDNKLLSAPSNSSLRRGRGQVSGPGIFG